MSHQTGVDAFEETRSVQCLADVERPVLTAELANAIRRAVTSDNFNRPHVERLLNEAQENPVAFFCPFEGDVDVDFDRAGHGSWSCPVCGSLREYEDE